MSAMLKLLTLTIFINLFLYIGVNYVMYEGLEPAQRPHHVNDDLFSLLLKDSGKTDLAMEEYFSSVRDGKNYTSSYKLEPSGNFSNVPSLTTENTVAPTISLSFSFLDSLKVVYAMIITLWRIAIMPIALFTYDFIPPIIAIIIGLPLAVLQIATLVIFIRGGGG